MTSNTKPKQTTRDTLYRAVDIQEPKLKYLHMSGQELTENKNQAWVGNEKQFHNVCQEYEWDNLHMIARSSVG